MGSAEDEATQVIYRFYDALEDLLRSRGTGAMIEIWHHTDYATTSHPFGSWARGWTEVKVNWKRPQPCSTFTTATRRAPTG